MSKWGKEEKETLKAIEKIGFEGNVLNIACGDGRFNSVLLKQVDRVLAIDKDHLELEFLVANCPKELKNKLYTKNVDITKKFPFDSEEFDGVFCTGTLHLFPKETVIEILEEIKRIVKKNGKVILDFATNIHRTDKEGNVVQFSEEGNYSTEEGINLFKQAFEDFKLDMEVSHFIEENAEDSTGYQKIQGDFIVVSAIKK